MDVEVRGLPPKVDPWDDSISPVEGIFFSFVHANGIHHRLASTEPDLTGKGAQVALSRGFLLVLFLHGFPESWYSWRFQLLLLQNRPFLPVAPDMRGYGATSQPTPADAYTQPIVAKDVVEIARSLGYDQFIVVGHDWGCQTAWSVALLYPQCLLGVCGMSVPYAGTPKTDMLTMLESRHGRCLDQSLPAQIRLKARFHYMLHHCLPESAAEYDKNVREFLFRMYGSRPDCETEEGTPEFDLHGKMFELANPLDQPVLLDATTAPGLWKRLPRPKSLPEWMKKEDLEYITQEYQRAGFHGGLCWYQAMKMNHSLMKNALLQKDGTLKDKIHVPTMFLVGERDGLIELFGGKQKVAERLNNNIPGLVVEPIFVPDTGHWIQVEASQIVNESLLHFLETIVRGDARVVKTELSRL